MKAFFLKIKKIKHVEIYILIGAILFTSFIIYHPFLFNNKLYIYRDGYTDGVTAYWPFLYFLSNMIHSGEWTWWTFEWGVGMNIFARFHYLLDPFNWVLFTFPVHWIPEALLFITFLKLSVSGILFYLYLSFFSLDNFAKIIGAILFAFNGYLILWGQHYHFASYVALTPLLFYSFEVFLAKGKWFWLVFSIGLFACMNIFFCYMFAVFLPFYALFRYLSIHKFNFKKIIFLYIKLGFIFITSFSISAIFLLPRYYFLSESPRAGGALKLWDSFFSFDKIEYYYALILNFYSNLFAIAGEVSEFYSNNYYGNSIVYSGLLVLLLIPQLFVYLKKREKILYGSMLFLMGCFLIFPFFSKAMNVFKTVYYRWTYFVIIIFILFATQALSRIIRAKKINIKILKISFFFFGLLPVIVLLCGIMTNHVGIKLLSALALIYGVVLFFLLGYFFVLYYKNKLQKKGIFKPLLLLMVCLEMSIFSYGVVYKNRIVLDKTYMEDKKVGYFDYTNEAITYIKKQDNGFYRIDKSYKSESLNDSLIQGYKGLNTYASVNQPSYLKFVKTKNPLLTGAYNTKLIDGIGNNIYFHPFFSIKYHLSKYKTKSHIGYKMLNKKGNVYISENKNFLPFGYTYEKYFLNKNFDKLKQQEKDGLFLKAFTVENSKRIPSVIQQYEKQATDFENTRNIQILSSNLNPNFLEESNNNLSITFIENRFPEFLKYKTKRRDPMLFLQIPDNIIMGDTTLKFEIKSEENCFGQIFWKYSKESYSEKRAKNFFIPKGTKKYIIPLGNLNGIEKLRIDLGNKINKNFEIKNFILTKKEINFNQYKNDIQKLKEDALDITYFKDDHIIGNIKLEKTKLLFFSIPYDKGWKLKINGKETEIEKVNIGFMGVFLEAGEYEIELKYLPSGLILGTWISGISWIFLLFYFLYGRKKK